MQQGSPRAPALFVIPAERSDGEAVKAQGCPQENRAVATRQLVIPAERSDGEAVKAGIQDHPRWNRDNSTLKHLDSRFRGNDEKKSWITRSVLPAALILLSLVLIGSTARAETQLQQQNERMFEEMQAKRGLSDAQMHAIRLLFERSGYMGQGNPAITRHPDTPEQCRARLAQQSIEYANPQFEQICGGKYMAPLYDPRTQKPEDAKACIDQFEYPDIPCAYPVVWVRAREAELLCEAEGKRLCDAHEWEGACQGRLEPPDYRFDLARGVSANAAVERMRAAHNRAHENDQRWSYGPEYRRGICATDSTKSPGCNGGSWNECGSNTYPAGDFPACHSPLGVYDQNGNAAEHMNLPLDPSQMTSRGSKELGYTEMKGSWFIFDKYRAHEDWCRWRAPFWHGSRVMDLHSHENYHLGFRCCKSLN